MGGALFAAYVIVCATTPLNKTICHEFQMKFGGAETAFASTPGHSVFGSKEVCDRYKNGLADEWLARKDVPFTRDTVRSVRCDEWRPDPDAEDGADL